MATMTRTVQQMVRYRHLLMALLTRAFARKHYRTRFGMLWLILQPIVTTLMYTAVFSLIVRVPADGVPYPIFFMAGYIPWAYFSNVFMINSQAIINHTNLIEHYNFPHIVLLCVPLITEWIEVLVGLVVLVVLILVLSTPLAATFWLVIPLLLVEVMLMAGISLWLAPLVARYKDLNLLSQPFVRFFFHAVPVIYPLSAVPEGARTIYLANPFAGLVDAMRVFMFGTTALHTYALIWTVVCSVVLLISGIFFFQSQVKYFADIS